VACLPIVLDSFLAEIFWCAARHRRPRGHRSPAFELHPYGLDIAVMMEPHSMTTLAVHDEQVRAFLVPGTKQICAQGDHKTGHSRKHLMHLRHEYSGANGKRLLDLFA